MPLSLEITSAWVNFPPLDCFHRMSSEPARLWLESMSSKVDPALDGARTEREDVGVIFGWEMYIVSLIICHWKYVR